MQNVLVPMVITREGNSERSADIFSMMLGKRIVFVQGEVRDDMANTIVAQLLFLQADNPTEPIVMYINSPGGSITAGMAIKDTMDYVTNLGARVETIGMGSCASMGAFLLASGAKGYRRVLPNTEVMIHQPLGGFKGQATDIDIHAKRIIDMKAKLTNYLSEYTNGKVSYEDMLYYCERDNFLTAEQALEMGLIDEIIVGGESNE